MTTAPITSIRIMISGTEICLGLGEHVLGRAPECAVLVEDALASRRHAAITVAPERVTIRDLGSRNGVLVNGDDAADHHCLAEGDLITLGSQALVVLQIARAGVERAPPVKPAPLGRIAVKKQPRQVAPPAYDPAGATTTLNPDSPLARPAGVFGMIAEAAAHAIATNRVEKAEKILEAPLEEVLDMLRRGREVEGEIIDVAVEQAVTLCEATRGAKWADYVHDLYDAMRMPMPLAVADRLALAMQQPK